MPNKIPTGDIAAIVETAGKIANDTIDKSKRRAMDFSLNQQQIQAQLGLTEKATSQQYDLARMNILAQAATNKGGGKSNTTMIVGIALLSTIVIGGVIYFVAKR